MTHQVYDQAFIQDFEARMQAAEDHARKHGVKRMAAGWYMVADADGNVWQLERGDFREYEGPNARWWWMTSPDGDSGAGDAPTYAEARDAIRQFSAG